MKLWLLKPVEGLKENNPWDPWYDKAFGFVVRAETEDAARKIANDNGGSETGPVRTRVYRTGGDPWLDKKLSTCSELLTDGEAGLVLKDFASA